MRTRHGWVLSLLQVLGVVALSLGTRRDSAADLEASKAKQAKQLWRRRRRLVIGLLGLAALAAIGFVGAWLLVTLGTGRTLTSRQFVGLEEYEMWRVLVGINFALWSAFLPMQWKWLRAVASDLGHARRLMVSSGFLVIVLGLAIAAILFVIRSREWPLDNHGLRTAIIQVFGFVAMAPSLVGLFAIGIGTHAHPAEWETANNRNVTRLLELRRYLRRFLALLGGIIGLVVLAVGALRAAVVASDFDYPPEGVVLYGALFTAVVAAVYIPAFSSVEGLARRIRDDAFPIPRKITLREGTDTLKARDTLGETLKLGGTAKGNLETLVLVFTPLLTSLITSALGSG